MSTIGVIAAEKAFMKSTVILPKFQQSWLVFQQIFAMKIGQQSFQLILSPAWLCGKEDSITRIYSVVLVLTDAPP